MMSDLCKVAASQHSTVRSASGTIRLIAIEALALATAFAVSDLLAQSATAIEFHNVISDHYFLTAFPDEVAAIEAGRVGDGWHRTGAQFKVWSAAEAAGNASVVPVCRFFGTDRYRADGSRIGPNSHFYTADAAECEHVKSAFQSIAGDGQSYPAWTFEAIAYYVELPQSGTCLAERTPIRRVYNNGARGDPNHRYTPREDVFSAMIDRGWVGEGLVMCAGYGDGPPAPKVAVVGGTWHAAALRREGTVVAWGPNRDNLIGTAGTSDYFAARIPFLTNVVDLYATEYHTYALREDGSLWLWGAVSAAPRRIMKPGLVEAAVSDYRDSACAPPYQVLCFNGYISWDGWDAIGRSADGQILDVDGVAIPDLAGARSMVARVASTLPEYLYIAPGGAITNWASWTGKRVYGTVPNAIRLVGREGYFATFGVLTGDGDYWRYGYYNGGGFPSLNAPPYTFTRKLDQVVGAAEGSNFSVVRRQDGSVWTWGENGYGQLGDGTITNRLETPAPVPGLQATAVGATGTWTGYAVTSSGQVMAWGNGTGGLIGNGSTKGQLVPTPVIERSTKAALSLFESTLTPASLRIPFDTDGGFSIDVTNPTPRNSAGLRSGKIDRLENAALEWVGEIKQTGNLSFAYRTDSEKDGDYLRVYVDGVRLGEWSGYNYKWTTVTFPLVPGRHRIVWRYEKDHDIATLNDAVWIGDITLPSFGE